MYQDLEPIAFKQALEENNNAILVDVRTPAEIAENSIEGHIAINFMDPSFPQKILELDKDKTLFIYCRSGNRSGQACKFLSNKGYENLVNLKGGMLAWEDDF
ncbi:MAG: rhodanese-like domain-containing protein [Chitinophagales bacterium]|nr:rhodanese-like domain-containing protein [Chitinophagales bacterium]